MEILSVNKSPEMAGIHKVLDFIGCLIPVPLIVFLFWADVKILFFDGGDIVAGVILLCALLLLAYLCLFSFDNYMRYYYAEENVYVQDGNLVIKCTNSILRRHKSIPLSSIRNVIHNKFYNATPIPDTLRVIYGSGRRYRFGIHMSDGQQKMLIAKIMELTGNVASQNK